MRRGREHDARGHREHDDGDAEAAEAADQVGQWKNLWAGVACHER